MTWLRKILIIVGGLILVFGGLFWWFSRPDVSELDANAVTGARPKLSAPRNQTIPTVQIADAVGWPQGAKPSAAAGLAVNAFATGLDPLRWVYRLANGDVLVAESNSPPRDGGGITNTVVRWLMGRAGPGVPSAQPAPPHGDRTGDGGQPDRTGADVCRRRR